MRVGNWARFTDWEKPMRDIVRYREHTYSESRDRGRREHLRQDMRQALAYARSHGYLA